MVCRSNWIPTRDAMVSCSVAATSKRWWSDPWNLLELSHFCRWCISEELGGRSWEYQWHPRSCPQQKVLYTRSLKGMKPNSGIAYIFESDMIDYFVFFLFLMCWLRQGLGRNGHAPHEVAFQTSAAGWWVLWSWMVYHSRQMPWMMNAENPQVKNTDARWSQMTI